MIRAISIFMAAMCGAITLLSFSNNENAYGLWYGNSSTRILLLIFCALGPAVFFAKSLSKFIKPVTLIYIFMSFYVNIVFLIRNVGAVLSASKAGVYGNWDVILYNVAIAHSGIFLLLALFAYVAGGHRDASESAATGV